VPTHPPLAHVQSARRQLLGRRGHPVSAGVIIGRPPLQAAPLAHSQGPHSHACSPLPYIRPALTATHETTAAAAAPAARKCDRSTVASIAPKIGGVWRMQNARRGGRGPRPLVKRSRSAFGGSCRVIVLNRSGGRRGAAAAARARQAAAAAATSGDDNGSSGCGGAAAVRPAHCWRDATSMAAAAAARCWRGLCWRADRSAGWRAGQQEALNCAARGWRLDCSRCYARQFFRRLELLHMLPTRAVVREIVPLQQDRGENTHNGTMQIDGSDQKTRLRPTLASNMVTGQVTRVPAAPNDSSSCHMIGGVRAQAICEQLAQRQGCC
jgi:hypothetical protein